MQGSAAAVLVPHDQTSRKLATPAATSSGVVGLA
jgi:hypothetical protein